MRFRSSLYGRRFIQPVNRHCGGWRGYRGDLIFLLSQIIQSLPLLFPPSFFFPERERRDLLSSHAAYRVDGWSRVSRVEQGSCARNSSIRATGWPSLFKSLCVYVWHIARRRFPPYLAYSRKMHLIYSSPRATLLHSAPPPLPSRPLVLSPVCPPYKVSSRFSPKGSAHGKYSLIATVLAA